jgi:hypothetical protein
MGMHIDEAGSDDFTGGVADPLRLFVRDIRGNFSDFAAFDGDIHDAIDILRRVDYSSTFDNKVIHRDSPYKNSKFQLENTKQIQTANV